MGDILSLLQDSEAVTGLISTYKPGAANIARELLNIWADIVADDRHYELTAQGSWKQYQAYLAAGFNEDQAMELLLNNNAEFVKRINSVTGNTRNKRS